MLFSVDNDIKTKNIYQYISIKTFDYYILHKQALINNCHFVVSINAYTGTTPDGSILLSKLFT